MSKHLSLLRRLALLLLPLLVLAPPARAFPPAPYYTIFGTVRDETGQVLRQEDAQIVLLRGTEAVLRAPVNVDLQFNQNYELRIPIDMLRPATAVYRGEAIIARSGFAIAVEFGGKRYLPVGTSSSLTSGGGSERERFDFSLGLDSDGDDLPDLWEEWQLSICGYVPGPNGYDLSIFTKDGDVDKDGQSNFLEYTAGTYACDGRSYISLEILSKKPGEARLTWKTVSGKSYRLERTTDLFTWTVVPFSVGIPGFPNQVHVATETGELTAFVIPENEPREFYRLSVQ